MQELQGVPGIGTCVEVRGESWRLTGLAPYDGCAVMTLDGLGPHNTGRRREFIAPFDVPARRRRPPLRPASRRHALEAAARAVAAATPHGALRAATAADLSLLPWQLAPALAALGGHPRLLIADEVGLGKTVQAGLIAAELTARGEAARILVVAPAGLRAQWVEELRRRFGLDAVLVDQARLARDRAEMPTGLNPWTRHRLAVTSIDLIRQAEVAAALDGLPLDLLIVDEAHHALPGTDRGRVTAQLAARALRVLLLTATPHSGDDDAYRALLALGAHDAGPAVVFRRTAASVGLALPRRSHILRVAHDGAERHLGAHLAAYTRWLVAVPGAPAHAGLLAAVLTRRAASSAAALARTLARRRALLSGDPGEAAQAALPWEEVDAGDDCVPDAVIGARVRPEAGDEQQRLADLVARANAVARTGTAKHAALRRLLRRIGEPAIVFTEYRDTLADLVPVVESAGPVALLHGGLPRGDREAAVAAFVNGRARVLLATDAGSEGLNLQSRCRVAINVEAPPSPTRLAQRAGRVARLGQSRRVHVFTLAGPFDLPALERLADRGAAIAGAWAVQDDACAVSATFTRAAGRECARLETLRRVLAGHGAAHAGGAPCALRRRGRLAQRWRLVMTSVLRDEAGREIETTAFAADVSWTGPALRRWRDVRAAVRAAAAHPAIASLLEARCRLLLDERANGHDGVLARARALLARASRRQARHQPSLFDGRATLAAAYAANRDADERAWWQSRVAALESASLDGSVDAPTICCAVAATDDPAAEPR